MSNTLTDWRKAIVAYLADNLQDGTFTVVSGPRDGPSKEQNLCHVFAGPLELDEDKAFLTPPLIVRAWLPKPKQPKPRASRQSGTSEPDPEPLEQLMLDLVDTLTETRVLPAIGVTFEMRGQAEFDYDDWGVQLILVAWAARALP